MAHLNTADPKATSSTRSASLPIALLTSPEHAVPEIEAKALGILLKHPQTRAKAFELLRPEFFAVTEHGLVYAAMQRLWTATERFNIVTLITELKKTGDIDGQTPTRPFLETLQADAPEAEFLGDYLDTLAEWARRRTAMRAIQEAAVAILDYQTDPADVVEKLESTLAVAVTVGERFDEIYDRSTMLAELYDRTINPPPDHLLPIGITALETLLGGFRGSEVYFIGGRPGGGKSALAGTIAHNLGVTHNIPGVFFSLEMGRTQIWNREIGYLTRLGHMHLESARSFPEHEQRLIRSAYETIDKSGLYIDTLPYYTTALIRQRVRRLIGSHGIKWVIIDYAGKIRTTARYDNRTSELSAITNDLKDLSKEFNLPIIPLHQLNRDSEKRADSRPGLSDFKGSGSFEEDADNVLLCYRPEYYKLTTFEDGEDATRKGDIQVEKMRNGKTGVARCAFVGEFARWENLAYLDYYNTAANMLPAHEPAF